jgi:putative salt-induced outer membrane protein YdiY
MLLFSTTADADVLVLKNGDRITGEIKHIWDAEITIEPEYTDEFSVDLPAVDQIISDRKFEIELQDGRKVFAQLAGADEDGRQIVSTGTETIQIALVDIFELEEPEEDFDWESHVDFSTVINTGNTDTTSGYLRADSTIRVPNHRHLIELSASYESTDEFTTKDQRFARYDYNWFFNDPWFLAAQLSGESDPIIELDHRTIVSLGVGRDIWYTPRLALSVQLGLGAQTEEIGGFSEDSSVATWTLRYRQGFLNNDFELIHDHTINKNIGGRTNTSYRTSTGIRYEITDLLYVTFTFDYDYETDPAPDVGSEDGTLLIGIGAEF